MNKALLVVPCYGRRMSSKHWRVLSGVEKAESEFNEGINGTEVSNGRMRNGHMKRQCCTGVSPYVVGIDVEVRSEWTTPVNP